MTADSDTSKDAYYVLFTAKDQYGNAIDLAKDTNALIQVAAGTTTLTNALTIEPKKITVDGVDYQAIKLTGSLKAGTATIILKGALADGTKVAIPADGFSVIDADVTTATGGKIKAKEDLTLTDKALEKVNSVTKTITVIINATGEEFQKEVVISKEAPKAVTVSYATDGANHFVVADAATAANTVDLTKLLPLLKIKDPYGVEHTVDVATVYTNARVTFTDLVNATVTGNGTTSATLTVGTDGNAEATVKITFADGSTFTGALRKN